MIYLNQLSQTFEQHFTFLQVIEVLEERKMQLWNVLFFWLTELNSACTLEAANANIHEEASNWRFDSSSKRCPADYVN